MSALKDFPQPKTTPLLGNIPDIAIDPVQSLMRLARAYGPLFKIGIPGAQTMLIVGSQAIAHEVLDEARFEKKVHSALAELRSFVGDGLFTAYNQEPNWGRAHRILMPAFSPGAMRTYFDGMLDIAEQMFLKWERVGPDTEIGVADNMTRTRHDSNGNNSSTTGRPTNTDDDAYRSGPPVPPKAVGPMAIRTTAELERGIVEREQRERDRAGSGGQTLRPMVNRLESVTPPLSTRSETFVIEGPKQMDGYDRGSEEDLFPRGWEARSQQNGKVGLGGR